MGKKHRRNATEAAPAERALAPFTVGGSLIDAATLAPIGTWYGLGATEAGVLGLSAVWRCVTLLADAISGRRWVERRGIEELPPSRLVRRPAASMTRREWTWRVVASLALYNVAPLLMVGGVDDEGVPGSLLPLPPLAVEPIEPLDAWGILPPTRYRVGDVERSAEELVFIRRAMLPTISPADAALLTIARRVFGQAIAADVGATRYWTSGGAPTTVLTTDQELNTAQAEAIAARWLDRRSKGPDYPAVLGKGAGASPYGADPTTESGVEARRELVADVARLFGIPTRLVNAPAQDSRTYANAEADGLDLIRYTLGGFADPIADAISDLLPGDYLLGRRVEIDLSELTRAGQTERYAAWASAIAAGWMTPAEVRTAEGLGPMAESAPEANGAVPSGVVDVNPGSEGAAGAGVAPGANLTGNPDNALTPPAMPAMIPAGG